MSKKCKKFSCYIKNNIPWNFCNFFGYIFGVHDIIKKFTLFLSFLFQKYILILHFI